LATRERHDRRVHLIVYLDNREIRYHPVDLGQRSGFGQSPDSALLENNDRIPLFDAEKQQKTPVQARRRRNPALQVVDSAWIRREFRYGAEQPKFGGRSGELNDLTDELQENLLVRRIFLTASDRRCAASLRRPTAAITTLV
jgi:hypothetical protein